MTQEGVVVRLLDKGMAQVSVERGTACGGKCSGSCEACVCAGQIVVEAENKVYAKPGDRVFLESSTKSIMGAVILIYMLPLVFFFGGLFLGSAMDTSQGIRVVFSLLGAVLGGAVAVLLARRKKEIRFVVSGYCC